MGRKLGAIFTPLTQKGFPALFFMVDGWAQFSREKRQSIWGDQHAFCMGLCFALYIMGRFSSLGAIIGPGDINRLDMAFPCGIFVLLRSVEVTVAHGWVSLVAAAFGLFIFTTRLVCTHWRNFRNHICVLFNGR